MKQYDSYKDSGVQWIGKIPSHWKVMCLKRLLEKPLQYGANEPAEDINVNHPRYIRITDITDDGKLRDDSCKSLSPQKAQDYLLKKGDILFARSGATVGKTYLFDENYSACFAGYLIKASCSKQILPTYLLYYTQSGLYNNWKNSIFIQSTIQNIGADKYSYLPITLPQPSEQQAIAAYLDKKCAEIDKAIATQQKRIELLQELRQNIITHAVTRGINPDAPLKDSGVEWIGMIPEHWDVMKTSLIYHHIGSGTTPSTSKPQYYTEDGDGYFWLQTGDLNDGLIMGTSKQVTKEAVEECNLRFYPEGSVVIAMYGATIGKVGLLKIETATNQACCVLPNSKKMSEYYSFYLYQAAKTPLLIEAMGGGQPNIGQDIIKKLKVPVPPITEQKEIVSYIEYEIIKIDGSISKANRQISLLQELKQSIITEVVTGKRKVC